MLGQRARSFSLRNLMAPASAHQSRRTSTKHQHHAAFNEAGSTKSDDQDTSPPPPAKHHKEIKPKINCKGQASPDDASHDLSAQGISESTVQPAFTSALPSDNYVNVKHQIMTDDQIMADEAEIANQTSKLLFFAMLIG